MVAILIKGLSLSSSNEGLSRVNRKEAWLFGRTSSGVRLCWELKESKGPKGSELARNVSQEESLGGV
jgi:hypothetical protein